MNHCYWALQWFRDVFESQEAIFVGGLCPVGFYGWLTSWEVLRLRKMGILMLHESGPHILALRSVGVPRSQMLNSCSRTAVPWRWNEKVLSSTY